MKLFSLLLSMSLLGGALTPGPLDGVYHSEKLTMRICDSLATFLYSEGHGVTYTVAVCTLTEETDNFIRLDNDLPYDRVMKCIQFEESFSADCDPDSVYVTFDFPVSYGEYLITVYDYGKTYKEIKYPKQKSVVIPRYIPSENHFAWGISNERSSPLYAYLLHFYLPEEEWLVFPVEYRHYKTNILQVHVPCIDDDFFGQTEIKGEYMKVTDEGLMWRGQLFKREQKKDDGRQPLPLAIRLRIPQPLVSGPETERHLL